MIATRGLGRSAIAQSRSTMSCNSGAWSRSTTFAPEAASASLSEVKYWKKAIATTINEILPRADALGAGSPGQYVLVQCATDYLPTSLQAYLDLPRAYADREVVTDGKTPRALLSEQLDVLARQINEVADAVNRADSDKLIANGRFLAEKFGHGPLDIDRGKQQ